MPRGPLHRLPSRRRLGIHGFGAAAHVLAQAARHEERVVRSVANLTRDDARDFLALAASGIIRTETRTCPLERANDALADLRAGHLRGAAVLVPR